VKVLPVHPFWHVGLIVQDLDTVMEELSRALGLSWSAVDTRKRGDYQFRVAFSFEGPPYIELLEGRPEPGSPWDTTSGNRLDYIGFWADDIDDAKRQLIEGGLPVDADGADYGGRWAYHRAPHAGIRVELVDGVHRARFMHTFFSASVGEKLRDFTVIRGIGDVVTSKQLFAAGPTVVHFFPFAFSGGEHAGCEAQVCEFGARDEELRELGVRLVGISHDSPFALAAWRKSLGQAYPLLSDWNWEAAKAFGVYLGIGLDVFAPLNARGAFLVDTDGIVRYAHVSDSLAELPPVDDVVTAARELCALKESR
jgi:peroxiredoxin